MLVSRPQQSNTESFSLRNEPGKRAMWKIPNTMAVIALNGSKFGIAASVITYLNHDFFHSPQCLTLIINNIDFDRSIRGAVPRWQVCERPTCARKVEYRGPV